MAEAALLDTHPAVSSNFFSSGMVFPESRSPTSDKSSPLFFLTNSFLTKGRVSRTDTPSLGDPVTGILIRPLRTWCLVNRSEMSGGRASPQGPFSRPANTHQHPGPAGRQDSHPADTHQHPGLAGRQDSRPADTHQHPGPAGRQDSHSATSS